MLSIGSQSKSSQRWKKKAEDEKKKGEEKEAELMMEVNELEAALECTKEKTWRPEQEHAEDWKGEKCRGVFFEWTSQWEEETLQSRSPCSPMSRSLSNDFNNLLFPK